MQCQDTWDKQITAVHRLMYRLNLSAYVIHVASTSVYTQGLKRRHSRFTLKLAIPAVPVAAVPFSYRHVQSRRLVLLMIMSSCSGRQLAHMHFRSWNCGRAYRHPSLKGSWSAETTSRRAYRPVPGSSDTILFSRVCCNPLGTFYDPACCGT